ncbi:MAG: DUF2252 family protein [Burkholderiaceae bacterium]
MTDLIELLKADNAGRDPERLTLKWALMKGNPFAFLRGTCRLFYERLPRAGVFKSAPPVWICGDLHLENFGSYKADNRLVHFDLNDFDEAVLAPASWELVRMLTSIRIAGDALSASREQARALPGAFLDSYATALVGGKAYWIERETADGLVRSLLDGLRERTRTAFLDGRTIIKSRRRHLKVDGRRALAATDAQRTAVKDVLGKFARSQPEPGFYQVLDVTRRIAGTGSLGVDRYAILVEGKGSLHGNYLLDLKEAKPSSLLPRLRQDQPRWKSEAERIVTLQRRMQAVSMAFLHPVDMGGRSYVLRGLQPAEDRVTFGRAALADGGLAHTLATMGRLVAWAQLRSSGRQGSATADELIDFGRRDKWRRRLLELSEECTAQCRKDSAAFDKALAAGAFNA